MSPINQRKKGASWERTIVRFFTKLGYDAERTLTETRDGNIGDVRVFDYRDDVNLIIEAKHMAKFTRTQRIKFTRVIGNIAGYMTLNPKTPGCWIGIAVMKQTGKSVQVWRPITTTNGQRIHSDLSLTADLSGFLAIVYPGLEGFSKYFNHEYIDDGSNQERIDAVSLPDIWRGILDTNF